MSHYGKSLGSGLSSGKSLNTARPKARRGIISRQKVQTMKLSFKQRLRNWLMDTEGDEADYPMAVEADRLSSDGMRLQIYRASGGYVVETRSYDHRKDENNNTMHVITDEEDLGERIGKIIMMEALRG